MPLHLVENPARDLLRSLPAELAERTRALSERPLDGDFILYWMRLAVRSDENQALEVALAAGERLDLPVFVYHGLSERYPYASDRHHTFILQGARDVAEGLCERDIGYALHVERPGHRGPVLKELAACASLVITEDYPVEPMLSWTALVAAESGSTLWTVDTACVVPMQLSRRAYDRAFAYRRATEGLRAERLGRTWAPRQSSGLFVPTLPFEPVDISRCDIPRLVASCDIDHGVGPVCHTPGGQKEASRRWQEFRDQHIDRYHRKRNDPLQVGGVSRLSAYLHYGHIAPTRVAREASYRRTEGAEKFLDELLIWREMAYLYCARRPDHTRLETLPGWARDSLLLAMRDQRPLLPSWEVLSRGQTGDELWDAAQRSLVIHGELHNNVRMTWGKALLRWSDGPAKALELLQDLNHRYALDGRDPASYGGILWCLGQFDRPFQPPSPILGLVRDRPTERHARRLDVARYSALVSRPLVRRPPKVAVVGAGVSGLSAARVLHDHGLPVALFDKGTRPGGRSCSRRIGGVHHDFGLPLVEDFGERMAPYVRSWSHEGLLLPWRPRAATLESNGRFRFHRGPPSEDVYVVQGGSDALARHLAQGLKLRTGCRVAALHRDGGRWRLWSDDGEDLGHFDQVILTLPPPQLATLLRASDISDPSLSDWLEQQQMTAVHTLMVQLRQDAPTVDLGWDRCWVERGPFTSIIAEHAKAGRRSPRQAWTAQTRPQWSLERLQTPHEQLADELLDALAEALDMPTLADHVRAVATHRWRYAHASGTAGVRSAQGLICGGDWSYGGGLSAAWAAGRAAAGLVLGSLAREPAMAKSSTSWMSRQGALL